MESRYNIMISFNDYYNLIIRLCEYFDICNINLLLEYKNNIIEIFKVSKRDNIWYKLISSDIENVKIDISLENNIFIMDKNNIIVRGIFSNLNITKEIINKYIKL